MKKNISNKILSIAALAAVVTYSSCTKLDTKLKAPNGEAQIEAGGAPEPSTLPKVYEQLNQLYGQGNAYAMQEHGVNCTCIPGMVHITRSMIPGMV